MAQHTQWVSQALSRRPCTYRSGSVPVVDLEVGHGFDNGHDGLYGVAVHHRSVLLALILRVAVFVDDPEGNKHVPAEYPDATFKEHVYTKLLFE